MNGLWTDYGRVNQCIRRRGCFLFLFFERIVVTNNLITTSSSDGVGVFAILANHV